METAGNDGAEQLARMLPHLPDEQPANLIATGSIVQRTAYIERVMDPELSLPACPKGDNNAMWMLENLLDLLGTAGESSFREGGCPTSRLTLLPHQHAKASLSTGAGGLGVSLAKPRSMSASVESIAVNCKVWYAVIGTWNSSPKRQSRRARATHTGRRTREASQRPGKGANRERVPPLYCERDLTARQGPSQRRTSCTRGGAFWEWRSSCR